MSVPGVEPIACRNEVPIFLTLPEQSCVGVERLMRLKL